jgi:tetratricopeptide (TPR) repeat protein
LGLIGARNIPFLKFLFINQINVSKLILYWHNQIYILKAYAMKSYLFFILLLANAPIVQGQKILSTISNNICDCISKELKFNREQDSHALLTECFEIFITKYQKELRKVYGDELFDDENSQKANDLGIDIARILIKKCNDYIAFSVDKAKEKKSKANEYFEKAEEEFEKELYDEAINNYTKAIANDAKNSNYYNSRGVTYYTKKEYYKAIGDFMKAIEVKPDYVKAHYNLAYTKYQLNDYNGALVDAATAVSIDSNYCSSHNLKGLIFNNLEIPDSALVSFKKAFLCDTTYSTYSYNIGYVHYLNKNYTECTEWLEKSLAQGNTSISLLSYLGNSYDFLGDYEKAIYYHSKNIDRSDIDDYVPFYNRAIAHYNNESYELALNDFLTAYRIDSTDVDIVFNIAKTEEKLNNNEMAENFFNKAIEMSPTKALYYDYRAAFYERNKNFDFAIRDYIVSLSLYPKDCEIHYSLGKLYVLTGDKAKANDSFIKSLDYGCEKAGEFINQ